LLFESAHQDAIIVVEYCHKLQRAGVSTESKGSFLEKMSVKVAKIVSLLKINGEYDHIDYLQEF
jgi:hypothetical protein